MIKLSIPYPVSVNAMYTNAPGKGRVKSQRYKTWLKAAEWSVVEAQQKPLKGWYHLTLTLTERDNRRRDPDNFVKAVNDLLKAQGLIEDDSLCTTLVVYRRKGDVASCDVVVAPSNGIPDTRKSDK